MTQVIDVTPSLIDARGAPLARARAVAALAESGDAAVQTLTPDTSSLMSVISRAASDPSTDVDKLERLMDLYERVTDRGARTAYDMAFADMQADLPVVDENGRIVVHDKNDKNKVIQSTRYAKQADINDAVKPTLARHGFGLSFRAGRTADGLVTTTAILSHKAGHREETTVTLQQDGSGSKNSVQAIGSSLTYGKRYATIAILNITTRAKADMDDGGDAAPGRDTLSEDQVAEVQALMEDVGADRERFLQFMKVDAIADIPAAQFDRAMSALSQKRGR